MVKDQEEKINGHDQSLTQGTEKGKIQFWKEETYQKMMETHQQERRTFAAAAAAAGSVVARKAK